MSWRLVMLIHGLLDSYKGTVAGGKSFIDFINITYYAREEKEDSQSHPLTFHIFSFEIIITIDMHLGAVEVC